MKNTNGQKLNQGGGQIVLASLCLFAVLVTQGESLTVDDGQSLSISADATYERLDVRGALTVTGGAVVTAPAIRLGSSNGEAQIVAVGADTRVGEADSNNSSTKTTLSLGAEGGAGRMVVRDGGSIGICRLTIDAQAATTAEGFVDYARLEADGRLAIRESVNESSATGRVVCAGGALTSAQGWWPTMFAKGAFRMEAVDGATTQVSFPYIGHQTFNASGATVLLDGVGAFRFAGTLGSDDYRVTFNKGATFNPSGKLKLSTCHYIFNAGVTCGPDFGGIELDRSRLTLAKDCVLRLPSLECAGDGDSVLAGAGALTLDVPESSETAFAPKLAEGATLTIEKAGAGSLTVGDVGTIPSFVLTEGVASFSSDVEIGTLTLASGTTLVVEDATVTVRELDDAGASIDLRNGGRIVRLFDVAADGTSDLRDCDASRGGLTKIGGGVLRLYDPALTGTVHVAAGTLTFSRKGLSDRYVRMTFKELLPFWYGDAQGNRPIGFLNGKVALYGANGVRCAFKESPTVTFGVAAKDLPEGGLTAPDGTTFETTEWQNFNFLFATTTGYTVKFTRCAVTNALDAGCWQSVTKRLLPGVPALDGFNFYAQWESGNPTTWTVETSATGEDDSWRVVLDKRGERHPKMGANNSQWMNGGDGASPAYLLSYSEPGVRGVADALAVQVDADATLDFTAKTGGQAIDRLVYDPACGGGVISNAAFAANGTLEIVNAAGKIRDCDGELPWTFAGGASGTDNVETWRVTFNGAATRRMLRWEAGRLHLVRNGLVFVVR